jgi:hypothetical protein
MLLWKMHLQRKHCIEPPLMNHFCLYGVYYYTIVCLAWVVSMVGMTNDEVWPSQLAKYVTNALLQLLFPAVEGKWVDFLLNTPDRLPLSNYPF